MIDMLSAVEQYSLTQLLRKNLRSSPKSTGSKADAAITKCHLSSKSRTGVDCI